MRTAARSTASSTSGARRRSPRISRRASPSASRGVVLLTHSETSTGVVSDVRGLAAAAKDAGAISVVDAVSSLGAVPLETDEWGVDVVVSGSQKALMTPPGLAIVSVSEAGVGRARVVAAFLLRLGADAQGAGRSSTRRSRPPCRSCVGLDVALGLLLEEGPRGSVRAPRSPRPRLPRGNQGDGARALLAGRRQRRRS